MIEDENPRINTQGSQGTRISMGNSPALNVT